MQTENANIYRIQFKTDDKYYDLFVRNVYPSDMHGFICIEGFLFKEEESRIINPRNEKLMLEFANVEIAFIPYYQIIRIDSVHQVGESLINEHSDNNSKIRPFPNSKTI